MTLPYLLKKAPLSKSFQPIINILFICVILIVILSLSFNKRRVTVCED